MVAGGHDAATALAEAQDPGRVLGREAVAGVDRQEPELVEVERVERAQRRVDLAVVTVAGRHVVAGAAQLLGEE